jgi:hypothetical protein
MAVILIGGLLGSAELASRYRDSPGDLLKIKATYFYVFFNALLSAGALWILGIFAPQIFETSTESQRQVYEVLIAGFGGAAFLRSSVAKTKIGDAEIGVGPAFVIDVLLAVSDREIDRERALARSQTVPDLMRDIPPDFAAQSLTEYCTALMQNLSAADERTLKTRVDACFKTNLPSAMKSILIGLVLSEYLGFPALSDAKIRLGKEIEQSQAKLKMIPDEEAIFRILEEDDEETSKDSGVASGVAQHQDDVETERTTETEVDTSGGKPRRIDKEGRKSAGDRSRDPI